MVCVLIWILCRFQSGKRLTDLLWFYDHERCMTVRSLMNRMEGRSPRSARDVVINRQIAIPCFAGTGAKEARDDGVVCAGLWIVQEWVGVEKCH